MLEIKRQLRSLKCLPAAATLRIRDDQSVETFLECIKTKNVELSLLALEGLEMLVNKTKLNPKSLQAIAETVTKITEFSSSDSELVEEGYRRAVSLCRSLVECQASHDLTNVSVSEIIILCFRVFNWKRASFALRDYTARELTKITKTVFHRLPEFPDDPNLKPSYQIRLRLGGTSSQSTFKELTDQFSSTSDNSVATSLRIINERNHPYNLAFTNDFFCYLASLINPDQELEPTKWGDDRILLGLRLLKAAFTDVSKDIGNKSCLLYTIRNNICYNLVAILKSNRKNLIISKCLNLAIDIFIELRAHLKYQFETFLERLMEMVATKVDNPTDLSLPIALNANLELRFHVLSAILDLFSVIEHLPHELYYNFDCDPYSSNIYENIIQICSKNCFISQSGEFTSVQLTSFESLLANLNSMHTAELEPNKCFISQHNNYNLSPVEGPKQQQQEHQHRLPRTYAELIEAKRRKRLLWQAIDKFNANPKKGLEFIREQKLIDSNEQLVQFLKDNLRVDKKMLGEYLAKDDNKPLRESFIGSLNFVNLRLDEALRSMLEKFRLPGESQLIERILDTFSAHWHAQNPTILENADNAMSLAYAIIMLNVDQHSKEVKKNSKPMTEDEFDRNLLGQKRERIYERQLLDQIFANIRDNEIVLPDEQAGSVRQRYLWKCIMVKSERLESKYLTTTTTLVPKTTSLSSQPSSAAPLASPITTLTPTTTPAGPQAKTAEITSPTTTTKTLAAAAPTTMAAGNVCIAKNIPGAIMLEIGEPCMLDHYVRGASNANVDGVNGNGEVTSNLLVCDGELRLVETNRALFEIMWSPTIAALSFIFDKIQPALYPELAIQIVDLGFTRVAHLCAKHGHLDNLVTSLCKFSSDLSPMILGHHASHHHRDHHSHSHNNNNNNNNNNSSHSSSGKMGPRKSAIDKNSLAARSLLSIIRDHGDQIRDSWAHIVRNLLQWFCSRSMDDLLQVDDFALQQKFCLRMREIKKSPSTMNQQSSTFLRSVLTYFASQQASSHQETPTSTNNNNERSTTDDSSNDGSNDKEKNNNNNNNNNDNNNNNNNSDSNIGNNNGSSGDDDDGTRAFAVLLKSIQDCEYKQESLCELISALVTTTLDGDPEQVEDCEVFKLEIFTQVILNNKSQATQLWTKIRSYYVRLASICARSQWLGERIISSAFRVAIQLKPKPEVFSLLGHLIGALELEIVRSSYSFVALTSLTELQSFNEVTMDSRELECCFNQVIFPFLDKLLENNCDKDTNEKADNNSVIAQQQRALHSQQIDPVLNRAINLACKIFLKHLKLLKQLASFATLLYAILDIMDKYMKTNEALKEAIFELIRNMIFVMDNEHCMSVEMKDFTRTKLMFWGFHSNSDYQV